MSVRLARWLHLELISLVRRLVDRFYGSNGSFSVDWFIRQLHGFLWSHWSTDWFMSWSIRWLHWRVDRRWKLVLHKLAYRRWIHPAYFLVHRLTGWCHREGCCRFFVIDCEFCRLLIDNVGQGRASILFSRRAGGGCGEWKAWSASTSMRFE